MEEPLRFLLFCPDGTDQFLRCNTIEICQFQQVGGGGISSAVFPFAHRLTADTHGLGYEFLRHGTADAVLLQHLAQRSADDRAKIYDVIDAMLKHSTQVKP